LISNDLKKFTVDSFGNYIRLFRKIYIYYIMQKNVNWDPNTKGNAKVTAPKTTVGNPGISDEGFALPGNKYA
jgi:hypothetical protein